MKITIVGHNACGKSSLANRIANQFNIPHLELDRLWFDNGGNNFSKNQTCEREAVRKKIREGVIEFLKNNESWVSDGFYSKEQPLIANQADQIVLIDIPLWRRQINHLKRIWDRKNRHPELSIWQELFFTYDMIRRTRDRKRKLEEFCAQYANKIIHITSHKEVDEYYDSLLK